jgi:GNAT superfamily N-acetyltransferase
MTMPVRIRAFVPADYPRLVGIANAIFLEAPRDLRDVQRRDELWDPTRFDLLRLVAEDAAGNVVAWAQLNHQPHQFDPRAYRIGIQVDPACQRQGIGSLLHDRLMAELLPRGATMISARVRGDMAGSVAFLAHRHYHPIEETLESALNVSRFDPQRAAAAESGLAAAGLAIRSLADEGADDPHVLEKVHALYLACLRDIPTARTTTTIPFAHFVAREINAPNALPEAHFLVVAGDEYVAMCDFVRDPALPNVLVGRMTGCLPAWRGKGIVTALKLRMAAFAQANGFTEIRTWNSARNVAMIRINEGVGFRPVWTWMTFSRTIDVGNVSGAANDD